MNIDEKLEKACSAACSAADSAWVVDSAYSAEKKKQVEMIKEIL